MVAFLTMASLRVNKYQHHSKHIAKTTMHQNGSQFYNSVLSLRPEVKFGLKNLVSNSSTRLSSRNFFSWEKKTIFSWQTLLILRQNLVRGDEIGEKKGGVVNLELLFWQVDHNCLWAKSGLLMLRHPSIAGLDLIYHHHQHP